ncbi:MAG: hypothetical protein U5K37_10250 [Natrialbaceae archaeon]|nr:hypothetical protein [Natrialbaceae archaeon]
MGVQEPDHLRLRSVSSYEGAPRVRHADQLSVAEYDPAPGVAL